MQTSTFARASTVVLSACLAVATIAGEACAQWPQWGGPNRNFVVESAALANSWPENGPPRLWKRELGEGYSSIAVEDGRLYTMYRNGGDELTVALDAATGETLWEHAAPSATTGPMARYGPGPHSTPLLVGDHLYTIGARLDLRCFEKKTGKVVWMRDLQKEYGLTVPEYGFSCSPLAYGRTIILPIVGEDGTEQRLIAFDQDTGADVWKNEHLSRTGSEHCEYSSPILINFGGEDQLVFLTNEVLAAFDPSTGEPLWSHAHPNRGVNVATPVWNGKDLIFCSGAYDSGARALRLKREGKKTVTEELWYSRKLRLHHGSAVLIGDHVYASSGDFARSVFVGMNLETGKPSWRERGFAKVNCVHGDGKLILLDEDGQLALATATPQGLTVHSRCQLTERISWTAPTLVGKTLYVRDRKHIMALDLG